MTIKDTATQQIFTIKVVMLSNVLSKLRNKSNVAKLDKNHKDVSDQHQTKSMSLTDCS